MKKILLGFLLVVTVFLAGCDPVTENKDNPNEPSNPSDPDDQVTDPGDDDPFVPLEGIDETLVLSIDGELEGDFDGEDKTYYFYLPEELTVVLSLEAEFDSMVVIKDFTTNQIVFEGDDSIYGDDVYTVITLEAGEYILELSSYDNEEGTFSISIGLENMFSTIVVGEEFANTFVGDEIHGYLLEVTEPSYYRIFSTSNQDLEGVITSLGGEFLGYNDDLSDSDEDFEILVFLETGSYILGTRTNDDETGGAYEIIVELFDVIHETMILPNTSIYDMLLAGETNVVEFSVPTDGYVELYLESDFDSYGTLYDATGEVIAEDDDGYIDSNFYVNEYLEAGTYTIEISGFSNYDSGDYELFYNYYEEIIEETTDIELDSYLSGSILEDQTNIYVLTITEAVTVDIYSVSSFDMYVEIYTSDGEYITYDDDSGASFNFLLDDLYLEPGVYYIHVSEIFGYPVTYFELHVDIVSGGGTSNPNDESFTMALNTSVSETLASASIHTYEFTVTSAGYITAYLLSDFDSVGYIKDSVGTLLVLSDDGGYANYNFKIEEFLLQAGTYYLSLEGYTNTQFGDYTLNVVFEENTNSSTEINLGGSLAGTLANDQTNTVTFLMSHAGYINAYLESSFDSVGTLNEFGGTVLFDDDDSGSLRDFALQGYLEPGLYEINIAGFTSGEYGNYTLYLDFVYGSELSATTVGYPSDTESILTAGEYDWYEFEVLEEGYLYTYADADFDSFGYLLTETGQFVTHDDDAYGNGDFQISWYLYPGTYYIVVRGYTELDSGDYTLHVEFVLPATNE
jgi:hypothetical protein